MAIPLLAAMAAKSAGGIIGGIGATNSVQKGKQQYIEKSNQGIDTLNQGKAASTAAYSPYTQMGATAAGNWQNSVNNRQQAQTAQVQNTTPTGTQAWLDPSANYSTDQANRAMQASAIAKGGVGGGMARALSNNANKMAMTNWNNAANQQLTANNQNFNQANTNYLNNTNYQQQQIENQANMTNIGLQANTANQGFQAGYNRDINGNYVGQADASQSANNMKAKILGDAANNIGSIPGFGSGATGGK